VTVEVWYNPRIDRIYLIETNLCGCCPSNRIVTWGKRFNEGFSVNFETQKEWEQYMRSQGKVKL